MFGASRDPGKSKTMKSMVHPRTTILNVVPLLNHLNDILTPKTATLPFPAQRLKRLLKTMVITKTCFPATTGFNTQQSFNAPPSRKDNAIDESFCASSLKTGRLRFRSSLIESSTKLKHESRIFGILASYKALQNCPAN